MIPKKLTAGDTIGVIAPSDPVLHEDKERLIAGCDYLRDLDFKIKYSPNLFANTLGFSASPQEKADDINAMFADPSVRGIICAQGGETSNTTLPYMDWEVIRHNPKVFLGISDITVLLNAIFHQTGLVTFHGNDILWGFGNNPTPYDDQEFRRVLIDGRIGPIPANRPRQTIRAGQAQGRLLGGNLGCILKLAGTPFWPDFHNTILFVEDYTITAKACHAAFHQLKQMGVFDGIKGMIVGYIYSMQCEETPKPHMEDVLLEVTKEFTFPILKVNDFGHNCPNTILPIGSEVLMDADQQILSTISPTTQ